MKRRMLAFIILFENNFNKNLTQISLLCHPLTSVWNNKSSLCENIKSLYFSFYLIFISRFFFLGILWERDGFSNFHKTHFCCFMLMCYPPNGSHTRIGLYRVPIQVILIISLQTYVACTKFDGQKIYEKLHIRLMIYCVFWEDPSKIQKLSIYTP